MTDETATNPVEGEDTSADTLSNEVEVGADGAEPELDEDGNEIASEPEDEEIELDDLKLKVPKEQAQKVREALLRQADYTRKTQEVADLRKAVEAERQTLHQSSQAEVQAQAQVIALDQQLARYQQTDWDAWEDADPFEAQKAWRQYQTLQQTRGQAAQQFTQLRHQRTLEAQQTTAKRIEEGRAVLARDIKDWSPQLAETLLETGVKEYGFDRGEIESFEDPRMVKVLHDAHQWRKSQQKQKTAQTISRQQEVQPAAKIGKASAPPTGVDDRLGADEWMRRRNEQARKRR